MYDGCACPALGCLFDHVGRIFKRCGSGFRVTCLLHLGISLPVI
jgi:hypothetical protein